MRPSCILYMTNILLNSRGFVIEVILFLILPFSCQGKNFCRRKMTKFWLGEENFPRQKILANEIFPDKVIVFPKSVVTPSKIRTVTNFYDKVLKRFPEKCFRVYRGFGFHWLVFSHIDS